MSLPAFPILVGRKRSGTTLLRAIFDSHPILAVAHEAPFMVIMTLRRSRYEMGGFDYDTFLRDVERHPTFRLWELEHSEIVAALHEARPGDFSDAMRALYSLYARKQGKSRYADKTPVAVLHQKVLAEVFPEARFIHIIRDGRDVALSHLDVEFGSASVAEEAIYWRRFVTRGRRDGFVLGPDRYREIRYEELLLDPPALLQPLCEWLDLEFDPAMLDYFARADEIVAPMAHPQARRNLYLPPTQGLRDWRTQMRPTDVDTFEVLAGALLDELGYERSSAKPALTTRLRALRARTAVLMGRIRRRAAARLRRRHA